MALGHEIAHLLQHLIVRLEEGRMQAVIDNGFVLGLGAPALDRFHQCLAGRRQDIVDHRGHTAAGRLHGGRMKIIDRALAHQFEIYMGVGIDAAGKDIFSANIDLLAGGA